MDKVRKTHLGDPISMNPVSEKGPIMLRQEASIDFISHDFDQTQLKQKKNLFGLTL